MTRRHRAWLHRNRRTILITYVVVVITLTAVLQILESRGLLP